MGVASNLGEEAFGGKPRRFVYSGPHDGAQRKYGLVRSDQIHDVPHLAPPCRGHGLVDRQVNGVKDVAEYFVFDGGEEAVIAVGHPFQACGFISRDDLGGVNRRELAQPGYAVARGLQEVGVVQCGCGDAFLAVVEDIDVTGVAQSSAVERR